MMWDADLLDLFGWRRAYRARSAAIGDNASSILILARSATRSAALMEGRRGHWSYRLIHSVRGAVQRGAGCFGDRVAFAAQVSCCREVQQLRCLMNDWLPLGNQKQKYHEKLAILTVLSLIVHITDSENIYIVRARRNRHRSSPPTDTTVSCQHEACDRITLPH